MFDRANLDTNSGKSEKKNGEAIFTVCDYSLSPERRVGIGCRIAQWPPDAEVYGPPIVVDVGYTFTAVNDIAAVTYRTRRYYRNINKRKLFNVLYNLCVKPCPSTIILEEKKI